MLLNLKKKWKQFWKVVGLDFFLWCSEVLHAEFLTIVCLPVPSKMKSSPSDSNIMFMEGKFEAKQKKRNPNGESNLPTEHLRNTKQKPRGDK